MENVRLQEAAGAEEEGNKKAHTQWAYSRAEGVQIGREPTQRKSLEHGQEVEASRH